MRMSARLMMMGLVVVCVHHATAMPFTNRATMAGYEDVVDQGIWCAKALEERRALVATTNNPLPRCGSQQEYAEDLKWWMQPLLSSFVNASVATEGNLNNWFSDTNHVNFPMLSMTSLVAALGFPANYFGVSPWRSLDECDEALDALRWTRGSVSRIVATVTNTSAGGSASRWEWEQTVAGDCDGPPGPDYENCSGYSGGEYLDCASLGSTSTVTESIVTNIWSFVSRDYFCSEWEMAHVWFMQESWKADPDGECMICSLTYNDLDRISSRTDSQVAWGGLAYATTRVSTAAAEVQLYERITPGSQQRYVGETNLLGTGSAPWCGPNCGLNYLGYWVGGTGCEGQWNGSPAAYTVVFDAQEGIAAWPTLNRWHTSKSAALVAGTNEVQFSIAYGVPTITVHEAYDHTATSSGSEGIDCEGCSLSGSANDQQTWRCWKTGWGGYVPQPACALFKWDVPGGLQYVKAQ